MKFQDARATHSVVREQASKNAALAASLWDAVVGRDTPADSYAECVGDFLPVEHAAMLAKGGAPTAYAFRCAIAHAVWAKSPLSQREQAREAWAEFEVKASQIEPIVRGLGWDLSEAWEHFENVDAGHHGRLREVEKIARLAGRMFASLKSARKGRLQRGFESVVGVERGGNIARILRSELMHLGGEREILLLERIVKRQALQHEMRGAGPAERGALVICLDESGSMQGIRREWSKAAAIALTRVAWEDKRPVSIIHYSTSCKARELKPGDKRGLVDMITHWFDGGTNTALALEYAAGEVKRLDQQAKGADVILVSDGVDWDKAGQERAIDAIEAAGAKLWTVAIECEIEQGSSPLRDRAAHYAAMTEKDVSSGSIDKLNGTVN